MESRRACAAALFVLQLLLCLILALISICLALGDDRTPPADHGIIFPENSPSDRKFEACDGSTSCITFAECAATTAEVSRGNTSVKEFPKICGYDTYAPLVCCKNGHSETEDRHQEVFPKDECASPVFGIEVIGGKDVIDSTKWPFTVGVHVVSHSQKIFLCGGSLISRTMVLSAAHCFDNTLAGDTHVIEMGVTSMSQDFLEFSVTDVVVHPNYSCPQLYNDIAVLKFVGLDAFTDSVRPVCLPGVEAMGEEAEDDDVISATVIGWGATEFGGGSSNVLQQAVAPIVSAEKCNAVYSSIAATRSSLPEGISSAQICAGNTSDGGTDACQGDSGGPLVMEDLSGHWEQVGIVSGGIGCATPGIPGIYTRVSSYVAWIKSQV